MTSRVRFDGEEGFSSLSLLRFPIKSSVSKIQYPGGRLSKIVRLRIQASNSAILSNEGGESEVRVEDEMLFI